MTEELSREEQIRIECLKVAAFGGDQALSAVAIIGRARAFESYLHELQPVESDPVIFDGQVSVVYDKLGNVPSPKDDFPVDLTGYTLRMGTETHVHLPRQHRDRKPPWCDRCGLTAFLIVPKATFRPKEET